MSVITGKVAFSNLIEHEIYEGKSTGKYSLVLTLDDENSAKLEAQGVKMRQYDGQNQRKFASQYDVAVYELSGSEFLGQITRGSDVRVQYSLGKDHPVYGQTPYLDKIRVLQLADSATDGDF